MSDSATIRGNYAALNELIVNCPDFERLEALLGGFNIFQVLKCEHGESRHSNVLAWILDPAESHGLDCTFLKKWLMRVIHESAGSAGAPISPAEIDAWELVDVEVRREWRSIDLLLILNFVDREHWVICIENKVNSEQHSDQLRRYRSVVESQFASAGRRLFLFLSKSPEIPEDDHFLSASYTQVHKSLSECLQNRSHAIGSEPRVLIENYLRLLEEKFMDESEIARTALRIYQQHRRALDVIFEHRPDNLRAVSETIRKRLVEHADRLGIAMESCSKSCLRFIPRAWDHPGNTHGDAWAGTNRTILFELSLSAKRPYLVIISGKAPDAWIEPLWQRAAHPPFKKMKRVMRPQMWCTLHIAGKNNISLSDEAMDDPNGVAQRIFEFAVEWLQSPDTQAVIRIIMAELPKLEDIHAAAKA